MNFRGILLFFACTFCVSCTSFMMSVIKPDPVMGNEATSRKNMESFTSVSTPITINPLPISNLVTSLKPSDELIRTVAIIRLCSDDDKKLGTAIGAVCAPSAEEQEKIAAAFPVGTVFVTQAMLSKYPLGKSGGTTYMDSLKKLASDEKIDAAFVYGFSMKSTVNNNELHMFNIFILPFFIFPFNTIEMEPRGEAVLIDLKTYYNYTWPVGKRTKRKYSERSSIFFVASNFKNLLDEAYPETFSDLLDEAGRYFSQLNSGTLPNSGARIDYNFKTGYNPKKL